MKLRAKANGNVIERGDEEARALLATGIYEEVTGADEKEAPKAKNKAAQNYRRRDMRSDT